MGAAWGRRCALPEATERSVPALLFIITLFKGYLVEKLEGDCLVNNSEARTNVDSASLSLSAGNPLPLQNYIVGEVICFQENHPPPHVLLDGQSTRGNTQHTLLRSSTFMAVLNVTKTHHQYFPPQNETPTALLLHTKTLRE